MTDGRPDSNGDELDPLAALEETVRKQRERIFAKRVERAAVPSPPKVVEAPTTAPPPVTARPVEPTTVEPKPVEAKPVEAKPPAAEPVETKPVEPKPVEAKPVEPTAVEPKAVEAKPIETKPPAAEPVETKPEPKPVAAPPVPPPPAPPPPAPRQKPARPPTTAKPEAPAPQSGTRAGAKWPATDDTLDSLEPVGVARTRILLVIVAAVLGFATGAAGAAYYDRQDDASSLRPGAATEAPPGPAQTPSRSL